MNIIHFPRDVLFEIFYQLFLEYQLHPCITTTFLRDEKTYCRSTPPVLLTLRLVCKLFAQVVTQDTFWRCVYFYIRAYTLVCPVPYRHGDFILKWKHKGRKSGFFRANTELILYRKNNRVKHKIHLTQKEHDSKRISKYNTEFIEEINKGRMEISNFFNIRHQLSLKLFHEK